MRLLLFLLLISNIVNAQKYYYMDSIQHASIAYKLKSLKLVTSQYESCSRELSALKIQGTTYRAQQMGTISDLTSKVDSLIQLVVENRQKKFDNKSRLLALNWKKRLEEEKYAHHKTKEKIRHYRNIAAIKVGWLVVIQVIGVAIIAVLK